MTGEKGRQTTKSDGILARLVRNYVELSDGCPSSLTTGAADSREGIAYGDRIRLC